MAKLIYSLDGAFLGEFPLEKERMTIGRRPSNDIHIDNLAISGQHAAIVTLGNDAFLEDLNSTNGTVVNGKAIKKHLMQHGDVIALGKYQLRYINEAVLQAKLAGSLDRDRIVSTASMPAEAADAPSLAMTEEVNTESEDAQPVEAPVPTSALAGSSSSLPSWARAPEADAAQPVVQTATASSPVLPEAFPVARIQVLNGPGLGKELVLSKALTTLGKPGVQVAVITRRPHGYFVTHVEGAQHPVVNGHSLGAQSHQLQDHDVVEIAGVKMEFFSADA